jgi:hypothetical protein
LLAGKAVATGDPLLVVATLYNAQPVLRKLGHNMFTITAAELPAAYRAAHSAPVPAEKDFLFRAASHQAAVVDGILPADAPWHSFSIVAQTMFKRGGFTAHHLPGIAGSRIEGKKYLSSDDVDVLIKHRMESRSGVTAATPRRRSGKCGRRSARSRTTAPPVASALSQ